MASSLILIQLKYILVALRLFRNCTKGQMNKKKPVLPKGSKNFAFITTQTLTTVKLDSQRILVAHWIFEPGK